MTVIILTMFSYVWVYIRMSNEQRQSRRGRKVTLAVICLITSLISPLIFFSSFTAPSTTFPSPSTSFSILNSHLSRVSLVSTLFRTTTSFLIFLNSNQSLICARTFSRNLLTSESVETRRVRPYSCFLQCLYLIQTREREDHHI